jgi:HlyD family secretion protein
MQKHQSISRKTTISIVILLICSLVLTACTNALDTDQPEDLAVNTTLTPEISASGEVVPVKWVSLSFANPAKDIEVLVAEGEQVSQGDSLVKNNNSQLETARLQAQAAYERALKIYEQTVESPSDSALKSAYAAFISARINLRQQEEIDENEDLIQIAQAEFDAARANYDDVFKGATREEIAAAEYDLQAAELALKESEEAFHLRAPFDGTVVEINVNTGETINALQPVLVIADLSNLKVVTTDLSEVDVAALKVGQEATIVFDALSDQTFSGTIENIANRSTGVSSVYYEVTLSLGEGPTSLRWGMTAFITFPVD